ncbi:MAG: restriction endonuclease [Thermoguttaceae bacterium]
MKAYSPFISGPEELEQQSDPFEGIAEMNISDGTLVEYVRGYIRSFRRTVEEFFPRLANSIPFYSSYPFRTTVVRLGPNGVFVAHRPNPREEIEVRRSQDFDPPFTNIHEMAERLNASVSFDARLRKYDSQESHLDGVRHALDLVLEHFWVVAIPNEVTFSAVCRQLLTAEGIVIGPPDHGPNEADHGFDAVGRVLLAEPAGFRRFENWAFEFKLYRLHRVSVAYLREADSRIGGRPIDVLCLLTTDDVTSVGRDMVEDKPRVRIWDRAVLNYLVDRHPEVLRNYFNEYPAAVGELGRRLQPDSSIKTGRLDEFRKRLQECPSGQKHFSDYERLVIDILSYLFQESLGEPKPQDRTLDGKQRRDVLFQNRRVGLLWDRVFHRFDADFVIVDCKNHGDPVDAAVIWDVAKYSNRALGRFILVVSRFRADASVAGAQVRLYGELNIVVLVLSDAQLLEMVERKERAQSPEDVLQDALDQFLRDY